MLENKLTNVPRFNKSSRIVDYALGLFLGISTLFGCGEKHGSNGTTQINHNPVITSTPKTIADEGDNFSDKVEAIDQDGDSLTYLLQQAPSSVTINANDGTINGTLKQDGIFPIKVEVIDGKGGIAVQSYDLAITNTTDNISGTIKDILTGSPVTTTSDILFGHRQIPNDPSSPFIIDFGVLALNGTYSIKVPTGVNRLVKIVNTANYLDHLAGNIKTTADITDLDFELIPTNFSDFFDAVARTQNNFPDNRTVKWESVPQIYFDLRVDGDPNIQPPQQQIDDIENLIRTYFPLLTNNFFNSANISIQKGINPPIIYTPGNFVVEWQNNFISFADVSFNNSSPVSIGYARIILVPTQNIDKRQLFFTLGAYERSNLEISILNTTNPPSDFQQADFNVGRILYKRPSGNISKLKDQNGNILPHPDGQDVNPDDYKIR